MCLQVDLEQKRLPAIFPAKMSLFRISRDLQLGVGHQGEPNLQVPTQQGQERKRTALWRGQGSWDDTVHKESEPFHWLSPCQEGRAGFPLPVGLCYPQRA